MDYGDRQERAEYLVKRLRENPTLTLKGQSITAGELADEIEGMTVRGRGFVAVAGIVQTAMANDPEWFQEGRS